MRPTADPSPPPEVVALVGFMGAGKTTVGSILADRLGCEFVDLDAEIERIAARPIAEIFRHGEAAFRELEAEATRTLAHHGRFVLATGGGWYLDPEAVGRLRRPTFVVWLRIPVEEALRRIERSDVPRPLLEHVRDPADTARRLLADREAAYARADFVVDVAERRPQEVARTVEEVIAARWPGYPARE